MATIGHNSKPNHAELAEAYFDLEPQACQLAASATILDIVLDSTVRRRKVANGFVTFTMSEEEESALMTSAHRLANGARDFREAYYRGFREARV